MGDCIWAGKPFRYITELNLLTFRGYVNPVAVLIHKIWGARSHGERGTPSGVQGRAPGQGVTGARPLKLKHFGFWTFNESCKFAHFSKLWKHKDIRYLSYLCKKSRVATKLGGQEQNWVACAPRPGPKTATAKIRECLVGVCLCRVACYTV